MSQITVSQLLEKAPDAQFVGGSIILHVESTNVEIGKLLPDEVVELTDAGADLLESVAPPEKKSRKRKAADAAAEAQLELSLDPAAGVVEPIVDQVAK